MLGRAFWEPLYEDNPSEPNQEAIATAERFVIDTYLPPLQQTSYLQIHLPTARAIALAYEYGPALDPSLLTEACYQMLAMEVELQFVVIPAEIVFTTGDPYKDSSEMMEDLRDNNRLYVFTGGEPHPFMSPQTNDKFRAVHDYFGHASRGFSFGPRGEENAWVQHSKMFTPLARAALTTETRGQNSWVNFGPFAGLPPPERPFAEQKSFILPDQFLTRKEFREAYRCCPDFVYLPREEFA